MVNSVLSGHRANHINQTPVHASARSGRSVAVRKYGMIMVITRQKVWTCEIDVVERQLSIMPTVSKAEYNCQSLNKHRRLCVNSKQDINNLSVTWRTDPDCCR